MKLIVGLGNPGKEYENTRHNIGFKIIDYIIQKLKIDNKKIKFNAIYFEYKINNEKYIFLKPLTYMNLSGDAINAFISYFDIDINNILIIHDDKDLEFADIRIKLNGSSAGHNGLEDIFKKLKTNKISRIRIGIGYNKNYLIKDWVLSNFSKIELNNFNLIYKKIDIIFENYFNDAKLININSKINNLKKEV